jgi:hypothetical protein
MEQNNQVHLFVSKPKTTLLCSTKHVSINFLGPKQTARGISQLTIRTILLWSTMPFSIIYVHFLGPNQTAGDLSQLTKDDIVMVYLHGNSATRAFNHRLELYR